MPNIIASPLTAKVAACTSLAELCATLRAFTPDEGYRLEDYIDLAALPTFGGPEPKDTHEIFSWDENNLLLPTARDGSPWGLFPRAESEE